MPKKLRVVDDVSGTLDWIATQNTGHGLAWSHQNPATAIH
jgi:hypothetical protein